MRWLTPLLLLFSSLPACDSAVPLCARDEDCPPSFRCDLEKFAGECVQRVYVIRCGASFCEYPFEKCVDGRCYDYNADLGGLAGGGGDDDDVGVAGGGGGGIAGGGGGGIAGGG
ncbi:hypothetical protein KJ940_14895, partial [Myxococcota bacterium]|nr:hypothetical protein [Myxococcota bacterium]